MPTISHAGTTITPRLVLGWEDERESRNVIHEVIGKRTPDVTLRETSTRSGTLRLFFEDEPGAVQAAALHALPGTFTLHYPERFSASMHYVVDGRIRRTLDAESLERWVVEVGFRETDTYAMPYPDSFYPDTLYPA